MVGVEQTCGHNVLHPRGSHRSPEAYRLDHPKVNAHAGRDRDHDRVRSSAATKRANLTGSIASARAPRARLQLRSFLAPVRAARVLCCLGALMTSMICSPRAM